MKHRESAEALCPFYRKEDTGKAFRVYCEGVDGTSSINLNFSTSKAFRAYKEAYCNSDYGDCPVYDMLISKYKD